MRRIANKNFGYQMINDVATNHICMNKKAKLEAMFWNILIGNDCLVHNVEIQEIFNNLKNGHFEKYQDFGISILV